MTTYRSSPASTISTGTEHHDFGFVDAKGRKVGCAVFFTVQQMMPAAEKESFWDVKPGMYLTAWGYATRNGKHFGAITGSSARFPFSDEASEIRAVGQRDAWVVEYVRAASERAARKHLPR